MECYVTKPPGVNPKTRKFCSNPPRRIRTFLSILSLIALSSLASAQPSVAPAVVKMGDVEVSLREIETLILSQSPEARKRILESSEAFGKLFKTEALRRVVLKDAYKLGIDRQPNIAFQLERARDRVLIDHFLEQKSELPQDYPSAAEAESFYESKKEKFRTPASIRLAQILIRGPMDWPREQRLKQLAKAKEAHGRLLKGEDFIATVRRYSEDLETSQQGGDLGWMPESDVFPLVRLETDNLPVKGITQPIRTQFGWQIVKIVDRLPAIQRSFAESRTDLIAMMRKDRKELLQEQYLKAAEENISYQGNVEELGALRDRISRMRPALYGNGLR